MLSKREDSVLKSDAIAVKSCDFICSFLYKPVL